MRPNRGRRDQRRPRPFLPPRGVTLGVALTALACTSAPVPGQSVVDEVIDAYGGADAIGRVDGYRQEGMLVALNGGGHGRVTRISAGVSTLSVLVEYPSRPEIRIVDGERGWRGDAVDAMQEVQGPLLKAMVAQAARAYLPRLLLDFREAIREVPAEGGSIVLEVSVAEGLVLRLMVDPVTKLVSRSESVFENLPGPIGFATDYSDFRPVNGVMFAFREETFASGVHTASMVLSAVELNPQGDRARLPVVH